MLILWYVIAVWRTSAVVIMTHIMSLRDAVEWTAQGHLVSTTIPELGLP